ncbi:MAG: GNAT family N-acetyltransferase [Candidatus Aminicenantales bacterium]
MKPEDRETVLEIIRTTEMFTPDEMSVAQELIDIYLDQPDQKDYRLAVVEDGRGSIAGYLAYGPTPLTVGTYDLYWIAVAPDQQGSGFGRELMDWLEKKAAEEGGRMVLIETSSQPRYEPTRRFYAGLGYKEISRIPDFYKPGDDRITFVKCIV